MGRRLAGLLTLALVGGAGQATEADGWFSGSKADLGKEELAAEQLRTGAHLKENPLKDGIGLPSNGDDREPQQEFFWFNEVTGEVAWELPVLDHENEEGEVYYVDTKTKEVTWDVPEHWNWHTVHDEESEDSVRVPLTSLLHAPYATGCLSPRESRFSCRIRTDLITPRPSVCLCAYAWSPSSSNPAPVLLQPFPPAGAVGETRGARVDPKTLLEVLLAQHRHG